jgi:hypothetical protein
MKHVNRWMIFVLLLIVASFQIAACSPGSAEAEVEPEPAIVEAVAGTDFNRVTLTERAAQRLGIETAPIIEQQINGAREMVVPYAAVIYGLHGETWVYTSPGPLAFMRQPITIDYIEDDMAVLVDGPPVGTFVATVGVAELYGTDTGVGK